MPIFMDTRGKAQYYYETAYFGWQNEQKALMGIKSRYKEAADQLVDYVLECGTESIRERFIFPILFCYRHSVEALLKLIYMRATNKLCEGGHDLLSIWSYIKTDIVNGILNNECTICEMRKIKPDLTLPNIADLSLGKIETKLKELQKADRSKDERKKHQQDDPKADVWRYLISPEGQLYFYHGHWVHYPTLKNTINELYERLDYLYFVVDSFLSADENI